MSIFVAVLAIMSSNRKISILPLLVVNFIGTLGYSIVLPSLVYMVHQFRGNEFLYGAVGATYSAFELLGSPILGRLSDRYGRKKILFVSSLGSALGWTLFLIALYLPVSNLVSFSDNTLGLTIITVPLALLFVARAIDGLTAGDISVANAYLADITTQEERKADFGKLGVAANLGFVIGPALAGVLAETVYGLTLPVVAALATTIIALVLIVWKLPESRPRPSHEAFDQGLGKNLGRSSKECYKAEKPERMTLKGAFKLEGIPILIAIYFVFFLAFSMFVAAMPLYGTETLHWSTGEMGAFFSVLSIVIVLTEGPILSWLNQSVSAEALTIWGTFIVVLSYLALLVPNTAMAYLAAVLYALGNGLMWPSFLSLLSNHAGEENQGYIQGIGNSAGSLASICGLLVGGALFAHLHGAIFCIPAGLVFIVFTMSFALLRKRVPAVSS